MPGAPAAAAAVEHVGAPLVRSRSGPASGADQPVGKSAARWRQDQVKRGQHQKKKCQDQVKRRDAHLTRPHVGVEGAANHVAPPLPQHVTVLGVYRDGQ